MSLTNILTPDNTEELKPGLFIQKRKNGYRQIQPMAWQGKIRWGEQMKTIFCFRTIFFVALVLFIYFGYLHDYRTLKDFYEDVMSNPIGFCANVTQGAIDNFKGLNYGVNLNEGNTDTISGDT